MWWHAAMLHGSCYRFGVHCVCCRSGFVHPSRATRPIDTIPSHTARPCPCHGRRGESTTTSVSSSHGRTVSPLAIVTFQSEFRRQSEIPNSRVLGSNCVSLSTVLLPGNLAGGFTHQNATAARTEILLEAPLPPPPPLSSVCLCSHTAATSRLPCALRVRRCVHQGLELLMQTLSGLTPAESRGPRR